MILLSTPYLFLKFSTAFPEVLTKYAETGGNKTRVLVLNWPSPYVDKHGKVPLRDKVNGFEVVSAAVSLIDLEKGLIETERDLRICFEELVIGPWESLIAEGRGLVTGDRRVTFLRTKRGAEDWIARAQQGVCSSGQGDEPETEEAERRADRIKRIEAIRVRAVARKRAPSTGQGVNKRCDETVTIEPATRRSFKVRRSSGVLTITEGLA